MKCAAALTILVLVVGLAVAEDKVTLKDGKVMTGEVISVTTIDIQMQTGGEKVRVPRGAVDKVERDGVLLDLDAANANARRINRPSRPLPRSRTYEATPALLAWIEVCAGQLAADDEGVRAGATAALLTAGKVAIPVLERVVESDDLIGPTAKRVLAQIERKEQRMMPPAPKAAAAMTKGERDTLIGEALKLTAEQEPKYKMIMDDFRRKQSDLRQSIRSGVVEIDQAGEKTTSLRDELDKQLAEVLTAEQMRNFTRFTPRPENRGALHAR